MEKINIDGKIAERADEFAWREYECGADERAHLSKGYYWGYKDAQKDLALTWEDIKKIEDLCMEVTTLFASVGRNKVILEPPFYEEVARRFNEQRERNEMH